MAQDDLNGAGAPLRDSFARTAFDALPLPGGRKVGEVKDLNRELRQMGVPGVTATDGREASAAAYAKHLESVRRDGGDAAEKAFLERGGA